MTLQNTHIRTAQTGMALCVALAALVTLFVAAMTNLNRLAGQAGGLDAPDPLSWHWVVSVTILPLAAFFVAFARTAGRFGAPTRLSQHEATGYLGLIAVVLVGLVLRAKTSGLETTLLVVALPPVLLFVAVRQNRSTLRQEAHLTSLEAERALP